MAFSRKFVLFILSFILIGWSTAKIFGQHKTEVMRALQGFAMKMREHRFSSVIMCGLVTITGVPPVFGYTLAVTMTGFIYGFPNGCIPATIGSFLSTLLSFGLIRKLHFFSKRSILSEKKRETYQAIQDAITQGGFKMILLIRICPLPWQLTNLILSLIPTVTWRSYLLASFIGSFRFNMDVWVGSQLANLSDPDLPPETHKATLVYMCIGLAILVISGIWIYRLTMIKIKEQQEKLLDLSEHQPLLSHGNGDNITLRLEDEEEHINNNSDDTITAATVGKIPPQQV